MADEPEQSVTVEGIIANLHPDMGQECAQLVVDNDHNLTTSIHGTRSSRHDFLANIRAEADMNINEPLDSLDSHWSVSDSHAQSHHTGNSAVPIGDPSGVEGWKQMVVSNNRLLQQQSELINRIICPNRKRSPSSTIELAGKRRKTAAETALIDSGSESCYSESSPECPLTDQNGGNTNALDDFIDHIADDQTDEEHEEDNDDTEDVLMSLKDFHDNADKCGPKINDKLAEHVMQNFHGRVSDEKAKTLTKNYDRPSNCNECFVPMTNEVVWPTLPKKTRDIDSKFQRIQQYQLKALYPTLRVFDKLFQASKDKKGLSATDTKECLKMTKDSFQLQQVAFTDASYRRRFLIKEDLKPTYKTLCNDANPITKNLLGDNLDAKMKEMEVTKRLSSKLKPFDQRPGSNYRGGFNRGSSYYHNQTQRGSYRPPYNNRGYRGGSSTTRGGDRGRQPFLGRGRGRRGTSQ